MASLDDDLDKDGDDEDSKKKIDKKKILIFLLPALIVIGLIVSFYSVFSKKMNQPANLSYSVVERAGQGAENEGKTNVLILYDIPEVNVQIKDNAGAASNIKLKISIELNNMEDIKIIEGLMPKITDAIIAHTIELTQEELSGSKGLYWLKEELLYRINLIVSPVVVSNLNFKTFGIEKTN